MKNKTTTAYAASLVVSDMQAALFGLTGHNSSVAAQFIQVHDAASLPDDAAVPVIVFMVEAGKSFSLNFDAPGRPFTTGIVVCNSSTGPTKTIGAADCWFDVQYGNVT